MTPRQKYMIGTVILGIAIVEVVFELLEMTHVIPKYVSTRELNITAMVLLIIAAGVRRRARAEMTAKPQ